MNSQPPHKPSTALSTSRHELRISESSLDCEPSMGRIGLKRDNTIRDPAHAKETLLKGREGK
jgi:hypothetical protein